MKIELRKYYDGQANCKDCKGCSETEVISCYTMLQQAFVDDNGKVLRGEGKTYYRNGVGHCCGQPLDVDPDMPINFICTICGN